MNETQVYNLRALGVVTVHILSMLLCVCVCVCVYDRQPPRKSPNPYFIEYPFKGQKTNLTKN